MKITFVLPNYEDRPIGGYKVVYEYANHLVRDGHKVTIVYLQEPRGPTSHRFPITLFSWLDRHRARLVYKSGKPTISCYSLHRDVKLVKATDLESRRVPNADAILATAWQTAPGVNNCAYDKGAKFYLIQHYEGLFHGDKAQVDKTLQYPMTKIVVSSWLQQILFEQFGSDSELIINPIDFDVFYPTRTAHNGSPRICMFHHEYEWKGISDGIEAFRLAQKECPDIHLVMFGSQTRHIDIDCEYHFRPTDGELRQIYNSCDIFLCASWAEGFGLPSAEALACKCCLVSTDTGGNRDYAIDEETALISPPRDPSRLAENLVRVIHDRELLRRLAHAGFERAHRFTWEDAVHKMETLLSQHR